MKLVLAVSLFLFTVASQAAQWVEIGADMEATYYVDLSSVEVDGETVRVIKKGVYTAAVTEDLGSARRMFNQTVGIVELDCARRINRVVQIDMLGPDDRIVWSSGLMKRRMWEDVQPNTHGEATLDFVCGRLGKP